MSLPRFCLPALLFFALPIPAQIEAPSLEDTFGRELTEVGVRLVDWEGHLANPAQRFLVDLPADAAYPVTVVLEADHPRLYFATRNSRTAAVGPRMRRVRQTAEPFPFRLAVYPDRAGGDEQYTLTVSLEDAAGATSETRLPIFVVDQDRENRGIEFPIHLDFDEDESGFFDDDVRALVRQVADDWAYFFVDPGFDETPAEDEELWIWGWPLAWTGGGGHFAVNDAAYTGFQLYAYGVNNTEDRSGGYPDQTCCQQTVGGAFSPLWRTGAIAMEVEGNFGKQGWIVNTDEDLWWQSGNLLFEVPDLYSITMHEMGHALAFHTAYSGWAYAELDGGFTQADIVAYQGGLAAVDRVPDHFTVVDRLSQRGAFGNNYAGPAPARRWLPTKLDVLAMGAIGYELRDLPSLIPFRVTDAELAPARVGREYEDGFAAAGGVPFYDWTVEDGWLPPGLKLDRFTGRLSGTPTLGGVYSFVVRARDYDDGAAGITFTKTLVVGEKWRPLGGGLAGANGVPRLSGAGSLECGAHTELRVLGGLPDAPVVLVAGRRLASAPLLGGLLLPSRDVVLISRTDELGRASWAARWPCDLTRLYFQAWQRDAAAPQGWSASGGLQAGR